MKDNKNLFSENENQTYQNLKGGAKIVGLDIESTGLSKNDRITQICIVSEKDGDVLDIKNKFVLPVDVTATNANGFEGKYPIVPVGNDAGYITKKTDKFLTKNGVPLYKISKSFSDLIAKSDYMVTYNGNEFDRPKILSEFRDIDKAFKREDAKKLENIKTIDVFKVFKTQEPQRFVKNTSDIFKLHGLEEDGTLSDVEIKDKIAENFFGKDWEKVKKLSSIKTMVSEYKIADLHYAFFKNNLQSCFKFYFGKNIGDYFLSHEAENDVLATLAIMKKQMCYYGLNLEDMYVLSKPTWDDFPYQITKTEDGKTVWSFSKNIGKEVLSDISFCNWILTNDFSDNLKLFISNFLKENNKL